MASPTSTFATLRALHLVITDALEDMHRVFSQHVLPGPPPSPPSQCSSPVYPYSPDPSPAASPSPTTPPASFPPTPLSATFPSPAHIDTGVPSVDYPSPDLPLVQNSFSEQLALHPDAVAAASRIVAACGQLSNIVHKPFLSLCDAIMSYNLPACMRLVEHLHVAEILREAEEHRQRCLASRQEDAGPLSIHKTDLNLGASRLASTTLSSNTDDVLTSTVEIECIPSSCANKHIEGLHVADITSVICFYAGDNYIDAGDLVHTLRLLSTHHIFRETAPDTFALNRVASLLDSGKSVRAVFSCSEIKYDDTGGIPAFVALITDELFKSAPYLTEAFTGVQLPTPKATPNPSFPADAVASGSTTILSTSSYVVNDPTPCAPTTRPSSVLTHIVYPKDEEAEPLPHSLPSTEPPDDNKLYPLLTGVPVPSDPLEVESSTPSCLSPVGPSTRMENGCLLSLDAVKLEKLLAFNLAFRTRAPLFEWLESGGEDPLGGTGRAASTRIPTETGGVVRGDIHHTIPSDASSPRKGKSFRLERFSKAMVATTEWEAPKAILSGFDWYSLPKGSTIVDVGGGIGSTTMILARALNDARVDAVRKQGGIHSEGLQSTPPLVPRHKSKLPSDPTSMVGGEPRNDTATKNGANVRFVVQDRPIVTALGIEAWRSKCSEMLESGQVVFQDQDFFEPQPHLEPPHLTRHPAVYLLRVVLHDWPDELARRILINLRVASNPETRLVIAEHVLPLACVDEDVLDHMNTKARKESSTAEWTLNSVLANVEGAERTLVPPPLLSNLGKASANAYWMDLIMRISLNGKERTLREFCALALSAGWRVTRMTRPEGSLFAYLVCEPITLPDDAQAIYNAVVLSSELSTVVVVPPDEPVRRSHVEPFHYKRLPPRPVSLVPSALIERSSSRCGTPTFGSRILLPKDEELRSPKPRGTGAAKKWLKSKGIGVRNVMIQKAESQREEQSIPKGVSPPDSADGQSEAPASTSHIRVWWKKSPPNTTSNSSIAVHELTDEVPEHRVTGRGWRGGFKSNNNPSTPSPRVSLTHQNWPSPESAALPIPDVSPRTLRTRRPSVASITRKLSFATFGRRPSTVDISEPLPTPPPSATLTELAPPPTLQGDTGRSLKHLPSSPTLGRSEVTARTTVAQPALPRHPSLNFAGQISPPQPGRKSGHARCADTTESPKPSILKTCKSPHTSKQNPPDMECSAGSMSTSIPQHQRRVMLSNSPDVSSGSHVQSSGGVSVPPNPVGTGVRRMPSLPKLPRRLSIPMLRRKQSLSTTRDGKNEGEIGFR